MEQLFAFFGEDRLGMKLQAFYGNFCDEPPYTPSVLCAR